MSMTDYIKTADFKAEKHVPVIDAPARAKAGEAFNMTVSVGKEIPHPNTTEHFIQWITLYYKSDDGKFVHELGHVDFSAHGASVDGANKGPAYTEPFATFRIKLEKPGTITALSYCNIHGLWESSVKISM